ncbi:MAG: sigma-54 interaction domain-containing protein [Desulfovibrio aminophilus]|uniref:sigma-54 interaction domain-containing protein n=1 Tax=Desulfovibrio aminophilus TaxID=81425 RepID=UPI0039ED02A3
MHGIEGGELVAKNFCSLLDVLSDGIYISDREGRTIWVNRMYERLANLTREELIGRNVVDLREEGVFSVVLNPEIVATGRSQTSVQTNIKGRRLLLTGYPIFDEAEQVVLVVTFVRDVTLMTQLKDQIATQREIIDKYHNNFAYLNTEEIQAMPFISEDAEMRRLLSFIEKVAPTDASILVLGETGVGKGVCARKIHELSARHDKPFFKVDCAAIPETLIESELFGYAPGAFTGAHAKGKIGFFEMADTGTLFLDEIGELPLAMQGRLLRALQDHEIVRVGSTQIRRVDVRVVAATNRDLEADVHRGSFRSDLYYRLRVAVMRIPSLRERRDDILPLARHFLSRFAQKYRKHLSFTSEAETMLQEYQWPGNVRELENMIQGLVITADREEVRLTDLPRSMVGLAEARPEGHLSTLIRNEDHRSLKEIVGDIEREILRASVEHHGSVNAVAKRFRIDRTTIFRKLNRT